MIHLLPLYMMITARMAGGGLGWNKNVKFTPKASDGKVTAFFKKYFNSLMSRTPEILFAAPIAYLSEWPFLIALIVSYFAMELGHGTFYTMSGYHDHNRKMVRYGKFQRWLYGLLGWDEASMYPNAPRVQTFERLLRPLYLLIGGNIMRPEYSWFMMFFKGTLIGLPLGVYAPTLGILWPIAYWMGHRVEKSGTAAELISGAMAGTFLLLYAVYL